MEDSNGTTVLDQVRIGNWTCLGASRYRFSGEVSSLDGFYADVRLEYRQGWRATIEGTNYAGDREALERLIAAYAESM